jgi:hypothetical protein
VRVCIDETQAERIVVELLLARQFLSLHITLALDVSPLFKLNMTVHDVSVPAVADRTPLPLRGAVAGRSLRVGEIAPAVEAATPRKISNARGS